MYLGAAIVFFGIYVTNVFLGATSSSAFMGDVAEMLTLFVAAIFFTIAILRREAAAKSQKETQNNEP
ncbi:MAG: hypothetical protein QNI90_04750 [Dinoroseobacter sp.]|nr:hypothetical protein [Dinoroseobacter sp.]MDJ0992859.1 hypothetical protein [Dinoroseobacter sp.]